MMPDLMRFWTEMIFNSLYLIVVWGLVLSMNLRLDRVQIPGKRTARLVRDAFFWLAFGDTFHVGSRTLAYFLEDGLDTTVSFLGREWGLVGWSAFVTALTVSVFYLVMLVVWKERYDRPYGRIGRILLVAFGLRVLVLFLPQNQWDQPVSVQPWGLIRNVPLIVLGLGVAYLIIREARAHQDRPFVWIGGLVILSYLCYFPVIAFVQKLPLLGMLMIPKTMAYVAIGLIAFQALFPLERDQVNLAQSEKVQAG